MASLNETNLIGFLGKDPEVKTFESGAKNVQFTLATTETYKDKSGEKVSDTTWHNIVAWGNLVEIIEKYLKKGSQVFIKGKISTRSYQKDDETRYITEIICKDMIMLGSKNDGAAKPENNDFKDGDKDGNCLPEETDGLPF